MINGNMKELCESNGQSLKSCLFFLIHICVAWGASGCNSFGVPFCGVSFGCFPEAELGAVFFGMGGNSCSEESGVRGRLARGVSGHISFELSQSETRV